MSKLVFIELLGAGFFWVVLPLVFYLNFRMIPLKCQVAGKPMSLGQRILRAIFPFLPGPKVQITLTSADQAVCAVLGIFCVVMLIAYGMATFGLVTFSS